jgi:putative ABC transport system permease protein
MLSDLRFALRQLIKTPSFTFVALLTLALGIGVNTTMFSVLNTLLLHQPPYPEPDRLIRIYRTGATFEFGPHSPANFIDYRAQAKSFTYLDVFNRNAVNFSEPGQPAQQLPCLYVSGTFFAQIGVSPALGRSISPEDDQPGHDKVVVLSDATWRQRFAADPAIIGRSIRLDSEPMTVIGVMPAGFDDPLVWGSLAAWRPMAFDQEGRQNRGGNWLNMIGRLKPGVTAETAQAELQSLCANLAAAYPATNAKTGMTVMPFVRSTQDNTARMLSLFAMGLALCVLLIACVNLANLLFARNILRHREHAIRTALGASRVRLIRQSLTESLLLAVIGGALGLLLAGWGNALLGAQLNIANKNGFAIPLDWRVAGFAIAASMVAGVGFGLLPALLSSRTDMNDALKQGTRGSTSGAHHRVRHSLIVVEVALALVLLSGAGFFLRGLDRFLTRDHGWNTISLLTARLSLPEAKYSKDEDQVAFYERLEPRLRAIPGVEQVALSRSLPYFGFEWGQRFIVEGQPVPQTGAEPGRDVNSVSPGYFSTMGIALKEGRDFAPTDLQGPVRTIISESMARKYWPGQSAVGKRIAHPLEPTKWQEIIGVVRDISFTSNLNNAGTRPQTYRLLAREPDRGISLALRCAVPPETLVAALRAAVAELDAEIPVTELQPATRKVEESMANYQLTGWMLTGFASLGLLLAVVGIYGVISGFVAQRTNEIGIRMALGAQNADVLKLVLRQGLRLTLLGTVFGLAGSWWIARFLHSFMPAMPAPEPLTAGIVALVLVATALIACFLPARRATKVDPMVALRAE